MSNGKIFSKLRKQAKKDEVVAEKLHEERLARCVPVSKEILKTILGEIDTYPIGDKAQDSDENDELSKKVLQIMLDRDVRWADRQFVLQLALQPISFVKEVVDTALGNSWQVVLTGLFGKKVDELTMADVDKSLRKGAAINGESEE